MTVSLNNSNSSDGPLIFAVLDTDEETSDVRSSLPDAKLRREQLNDVWNPRPKKI